jgi:hypothetical protein
MQLAAVSTTKPLTPPGNADVISPRTISSAMPIQTTTAVSSAIAAATTLGRGHRRRRGRPAAATGAVRPAPSTLDA